MSVTEEVRAEVAWRYKEISEDPSTAIMQTDYGDYPKALLPVYKVYGSARRFDLSYPLPQNLNELAEATAWVRLSSLLHNTLGLNQLFSLPQQNMTFGFGFKTESYINSLLRRNVPSGGALYPSELYVWLNAGWPLPAGFYHYDPAHHQLAQLREGSFGPVLAQALGCPLAELAEAEAVILGSLRLSKNFAKYGDLTYRLQSLDSGVVQGRLAQLAQTFDWPVKLYWQFDDERLNELLGLDTNLESIYHVSLLTPHSALANAPATVAEQASAAPTEIAPLDLSFNHNEVEPHLNERLREMHRVSLYSPTDLARSAPQVLPGIKLPFALGPAIRHRYSNGMAFAGKPIEGGILHEMARQGYRAVQLAAATDSPLDLDLYFLALNVRGLEAGAYHYNPALGELEQVAALPGLALKLLEANFYYQIAPFDPYNICAAFYPVGSYEQSLHRYGNRGFRLLNLAAGAAIDTVQTAAGGGGLDSANYLGFSPVHLHQMLNLSPHQNTLMQLLIGKTRPDTPVYQGFLG